MVRTACLLLCSAAALAAPETAGLSGYGRLGLSCDAQTATFTCQSPDHADRLLSKLRADLTWDRLGGLHEVPLPGGGSALAGEGGVLVLFRRGAAVQALAAADPAVAAQALDQRGLRRAELAFTPRARHPLALDFYDLRPISMYYLSLNVRDLAKGWQRYDRAVLNQAADYWRGFGFGHSAFGPYLGADELADGAMDFFPLGFMARQAAERDAVVMRHLGMYWAPWWLRNRYPRDVIGWDPYALSGWNPLGAMAGSYLSGFASDPAYAYARRFTTAAVDRLRRDAGDRLGCYRVVGGGHPGDEMGLHHLSTEFMDYDEAAQAAFRGWLREVRGLDLAALGRRWYDDPARFQDWSQVRIPSEFEFFGGFGDDSFDLLTGWQWRPDSPNAETEGWAKPDYVPGEEWTPVDLAPSMKQLFLFGSERDKELRTGRSKVAWFRQEFDPSAWLAKHRGGQVYVVAQVGDSVTEPVEVYLNDAYLGPIKPKTVWCGPIAFQATTLLQPGRNVLCLKTRNGLIRGPVFLTTQQPKRYPYLGRTANARWVDLRDWTAEKLSRGWLREARPARAKDPDTPFMFVPGGSHDFADSFLGLKRELGISSLHHTGGGSSYMPWWAGQGYVLGAYKSSEEGGTISDPNGLSRELAWLLLDGSGHHNYYYDALDYQRLDQKTGWFTAHRRLFELCGKATWVKPPVAVLRAASSDRYFPYSAQPDDWDIGRSSLQAAHYQNVYVTEAEVKAGLADAYPVLFDAGTMVLDDALLAALERYVRGGGTFVAVNVTGRHTPLDADAWPIERLTGFKVVGERENMHVTVLPDNPLFKRLAGMTFNGSGVAVNWLGVNHLAEGAVALAPNDGDGAVLARWEDGTAAVGLRRLGKGRVIVLGSSFWRSMSDRAGTGVSLNGTIQTTFFGDLFAGLGIARQAEIDSEDVWLRRLVTKNGLQEWVMAYNAGRGPLAGLTLTFPLAKRPERVVDVVTGQPVAFDYADGQVRLAKLDLGINGLRIFGVARDGFVPALAHWFAEKCKYERRPEVTPTPEPPAPPAEAVAFRTFRFRPADATAKDQLGWLAESTTGWTDVGHGFWDDLGYPAKGTGLYRQGFELPAAWRGRRVLLACASFDTPVFAEHAAFYLNGQPAGEYQGHPWANLDVLDVTGLLKPGHNELAVRVEATEVRGGYLGQLVLYPLAALTDVRELKTDWRVFSDNRRSTQGQLPLDVSARHLETDVTLPAGWRPEDATLEFEVADKCLGLVVINGRAIGYNSFLHPFPNLTQVSLYPWARPGQVNRIELWPRSPEETPRARLRVNAVRVGAARRSG